MFIFLGLISGMGLLMTACSDDKKEASNKTEVKNDHVWKQQTDALQSAKDMQKNVQKSIDEQQKKLEESN